MYLKAHSDKWTSAKHAAQWPATLEQYAYPKIGAMSVTDIDVDDVIRCIEPIWKSIPETANRVRGRIEAILGYATVRKFRTGDNPARWRGHLATLLPAKGKLRETAHHAALPYADMPAFMADLRKRTTLSARALEFTILTAARTGEVNGATWEEVDLKAKKWAIPASRMKSGREHAVPLCDRALAILKSLKHQRGPVFGLSNIAMLETLQIMRPGMTTHGMRSTFRDWAAERTNFPREVCEQALAHTISNSVEKAYRRGDLFEKRRRLMTQWADYCSKPAQSGEVVVPIRRAQ